MCEVKKQALATNDVVPSANEIGAQSKDTTLNLPRQLKRILLYLAQQSEPKTVINMMQDLFMPDPRGCISQLRKRGFVINSYWCKSETGRYKRYYIRKEGNNGE